MWMKVLHRILLIAAAGTMLAATALVLPTAAASGVPRCAVASLVAWGGPSTGASGSVTAEFGFTNHSAGSCSLDGYTHVQMLNKGEKNLPTSDQKAPSGAFGIKEKTVVLAAGKTAYFGVVYRDSTGYAHLTCPTSVALKFTPPQETATVTLKGSRAQIQPYGGTTKHLKCGIVQVTPVTAKRFQ